MADDWIKMRCGLADEPEVIEMSMILDLDPDTIVGKLHKLWSWADKVSRDGYARGVTFSWINRHIHCESFAETLQKVGWLEDKKGGILFPKFERHMSKSAKNRALAQERMSRKRYADSVTKASPEKRREEIDIPNGISCGEAASQSATSDVLSEEQKTNQSSQVSPRISEGEARPAAVLTFPCRGNLKSWELHQSFVDELKECYPGLDVLGECRKAYAWCRTNVSNQKTAGGMPKFLNGWISRACNAGAKSTGPPQAKRPCEDTEATKAHLRMMAEREKMRDAQPDHNPIAEAIASRKRAASQL